MLPADAFFDWLSLKLWILYYNMQLTPEEKRENKIALRKWEHERKVKRTREWYDTHDSITGKPL